MRKIWLIARREYVYNFRRRSFLFTAFGVPLFTFGMWFLIFAVAENVYGGVGSLGNIGYVDEAGILADAVEKPEEYLAFPDEETAHQALLDGEIGAYFVIDANFLSNGQVDGYAFEGIPDGIEAQLEDFLKANVAHLVPSDAPLDRLLDPMDVTVVETSTGNRLGDEGALVARILTPFIFALLYLMAVNTTSQFLMSGVVEEKENRMMEILATSSTPLQMLWGKVLGLGTLGLTQVVIWGAAGAVLLNLQTENSFLSGISISTDYLLISLAYLILGYFLFAAIMAGVGASVTAEQEGRQFAGLFSFVAVLPMVLSFSFFQDPNGTLPVVLSLFPLTAPIAMIVRVPLVSVPAWQLIASLGILALTTLGMVWLAARVFRLGMLMYGKRLTLREIANALRQGRRVMTTVARAEEGVA